MAMNGCILYDRLNLSSILLIANHYRGIRYEYLELSIRYSYFRFDSRQGEVVS